MTELKERERRISELEDALRSLLNTRPTWSLAYGYAEDHARSVLNKENSTSGAVTIHETIPPVEGGEKRNDPDGVPDTFNDQQEQPR